MNKATLEEMIERLPENIGNDELEIELSNGYWYVRYQSHHDNLPFPSSLHSSVNQSLTEAVRGMLGWLENRKL